MENIDSFPTETEQHTHTELKFDLFNGGRALCYSTVAHGHDPSDTTPKKVNL